MPEPTAPIPVTDCVAIEDWDTLLFAVQEAFSLNARDRPAATAGPTPDDTAALEALHWGPGYRHA